MATVSAESLLVESAPKQQANQQPQETISASVSVRTLDATDTLARHILLYSFVAAVLLAIGGFVVVTIYLFRYLNHAFTAFDLASMKELASLDPTRMQPILLARAGLWKFILQSCGIIAGVAFGFLGFGLFLLGAKGDMDAAFDDSQHKVQLSRMAPGSFVILIAAVLIGICAIHKVDLSFTPVTTTITTTGQNGIQTGGGGAVQGPRTSVTETPAANAQTSSDPSVNPNASFYDAPATNSQNAAKPKKNGAPGK